MNNLNEKLKQIEQEIKKLEFEENKEEDNEYTSYEELELRELQAQKKLILEVIELVKRERVLITNDNPDEKFYRGYNQALKDLLGDEKWAVSFATNTLEMKV